MSGRWRVTCWSCGGEGVGEGCTCWDDACCCRTPTPPVCDICKGDGGYIVTELTDDNYEDAIPVPWDEPAPKKRARP